MHSTDLNLLYALDALLAEGSVLGAAKRVGLSPPAMSRTLARIRAATGDPVLVRAGRRLVPSPRANAIRERVRTLVLEAEALLRPAAALDVAKLERVFTIRAADYAVATLVAALDRIVAREAPNVVLRVVPEGDEEIEPLRAGAIDLDIGVQSAVGPELRLQTLFRDELVAVVRAGHPLARAKGASPRLSLQRFAAASHAVVSRRGKLRGGIDDDLAAAKLARRVVRTVPSFLAGAWLASESDYVVMLPRRLAERVAEPLALRIVKLPVAQPPIVVAQMWHPRFDADVAHGFLRDAVRRASQSGRRSVTK